MQPSAERVSGQRAEKKKKRQKRADKVWQPFRSSSGDQELLQTGQLSLLNQGLIRAAKVMSAAVGLAPLSEIQALEFFQEWWSVCGCVADLVSATNTTNVNIPQMADTLFERATNASWVVVFKALVTTHHMCVHGNEVSDWCWGGGVRPNSFWAPVWV